MPANEKGNVKQVAEEQVWGRKAKEEKEVLKKQKFFLFPEKPAYICAAALPPKSKKTLIAGLEKMSLAFFPHIAPI